MRAIHFSLAAVSSILAGGALLPITAVAQTTATTVPVGYVQTVITPATDSNTPSSQVISVPFYNSAVAAGAVTSVDSATAFSSSAASFGSYATAAAPYLVHMKSGTSVGRYFLISANTTTQVTVYNRSHDLTVGVAVGDTFEIVPANTLATLLGASTSSTPAVALQTGASASVADNVDLCNGTSFDTYYNNGTNWKKSGSLLNQNNTVLYPDEGIFIIRRGTAALSLTFLGTVPSTTEKSDIVTGSTFLSNRFPVDTTLLALGIQNLPNWVSGATANSSDNVDIFNGTTFLTYCSNGTNWKRAGSLANFNTQAIPTGSAVFVVRTSSATGDTASLSQTLPYSLN